MWAAWLSQPLFLSHKLAWEPQWLDFFHPEAPASGTDVIYTDFQKAFDQVPSRRLLYKLSLYGIRGKILRWLSTFLIGRKRVVLEGTPSPWCAVTSGVPQFTILDLIMFLFLSTTYLKRFQHMWSCSPMTVKLYSLIRNRDDCAALQYDLDTLVARSRDRLLGFSEEKCIKTNYSYPYAIGGHNLGHSSQQKDLDIIMHLTWSLPLIYNLSVRKTTRKTAGTAENPAANKFSFVTFRLRW